MEYRGTFEELKNIILEAGHQITEEKTLGNAFGKTGYQLRLSNTAILNWYEKKGKLNFQGGETAKQELEKCLTKHVKEKTTTSSPKTAFNVSKPLPPEIFIVHGHDHFALKQLELVLHKFGLAPYVLQNTSGNGLTIIEALENKICNPTSSIKFGIVLLTPDDVGYATIDGQEKAQPRARQNVILEMGMLIAAFSRQNVAILKKEGIEIPSNFDGIIYTPFKSCVKETIPNLYNRLCASGFTITADQLANALQ